MNANPPLLTVEDAAAYLAVSEQMIRKLGESGRLPRVHIGRAVRFRRVDLDAYIEQNLTPSAAVTTAARATPPRRRSGGVRSAREALRGEQG